MEAHPDFVRPERYRNEVLGFLREPLQDLSISRPKSRLQWGIPLPFDDRYVTYVWFDALINYVSALGGPGGERFRRYWPHVQHLIGKDILKPHGDLLAVHAEGGRAAPRRDRRRRPPVRAAAVHGYWTLGGGKISKSVGNVVEALALNEKYGNDAFRYFVLREMAFGLDADFSEEAFVERLNADLANDLGNLVVAGDDADREPRRAARRADAAAVAPDAALAEAVERTRRAVERGDGRVRVPAGAGGDLGVRRRS